MTRTGYGSDSDRFRARRWYSDRAARTPERFGIKTASPKPASHRYANLVGDLIQGMAQNRHLARAMSDAGWGEFRRVLESKTAWYGC